ncbi:MAG: FMN-binding protein [Chloroflexi bacterium]|nr:MAG: FMN-binding protein [Chloroflexota bacterium]
MAAKQKGKSKVKGCAIVLLAILVLLAVGGGIGWSRLAREHREARSLPLNAVDFDRLKDDGVYHGVYEGGMYGWRANECDVTVTNGRVTGIRLVVSQDSGAENTDHEMLYDRVIEAQSLQVDTISGATLTSKGWLQCVENALIQAQHE